MDRSLKSKSAKSIVWDFSGNLFRHGITFLLSIVLARLLTPAEFGLVGMAMVFITVSQVFVDVGFASALIQRQDNTKTTYSSIFYLNVFLGLTITAIFYFIAPWIGSFYKNNEVTSLVRWLSLAFIFNSFDIVQISILKKELNFKALSIRIVIAAIVGGVLGITAALLGMGVYSLVIQNLSNAFIGTALLWSTSNWRPDFIFSFKEVKKLSGFSIYVFLDRMLSNLSQQLDVLAVGKVFNPAILGFYSRATSLRNVVTQYSSTSLISVFYPVLSSLQNNQKDYERVYFKVISVIALLSYGITGLMCILGKDIILILFGAKWIASVPIFQVIILMACNTPINGMMVNAFMSKGHSKENFWIGVLRKIVRFLPILVLISFGMFEFTVSIVFVSYFLTFINIYFLYRVVGLSYKMHLKKIFEGVIPLIVILSAFFFINPTPFYLRIFWATGFIIIYILYNRLLKVEGYIYLVNNIPLIKSKFLKKKYDT